MKLFRFISYFKKPWVIASLIVLIIIIGLIARGSQSNATEEIFEVKSTTVSEEVSVTGKVKPAQAVDLSFEKAGKVTTVLKDIGDEVRVGTVLVRISASDILADLAQAEAQVRYQKAKLAELEVGVTFDIDTTKMSLISTLQSAYTTADDAIRNKVDSFFINPESGFPRLRFAVQGSSLNSSTIETGRLEVGRRLQSMQSMLNSVQPNSDIEELSTRIKRDLGEIKLFLDNTALAVNMVTTDNAPHVTAAEITDWKADLSSARSTLNTAITNVLTADEKFRSAKSGGVQTVGANAQKIEAQRAQVAQAQAQVAKINAELAKTSIRSPIAGIVTAQDAKVGEIVYANTKVVSVISNARYAIEANIPEADLAKVKIGQKAKVTLDAYGSDVEFQAVLTALDPAETVIDGVPTYKASFQFIKADDRIRSGMTANIDIQGQSHQNVLAIPQRAITSRDGEKYVLIQKDKETTEEVKVKTGIRGNNGLTEIVSGLKAGDMVVVRQK